MECGFWAFHPRIWVFLWMETKMGVPDGAEIAFRRKIAYFCCMRKTFVILLAVAAVCGCRQGYKMECGQSFELATPWVLNHDGGEPPRHPGRRRRR